MGNLLDSANRYMPLVNESETIEEMGIERHIGLDGGGEGSLEKELTLALGDEGGMEGEEGEEMEMISVEDAKAAIQLAIDGEVDDAEAALAMVSSPEEGGEELGGDEMETEYECADVKIDGDKEEIEEEDEVVVDDVPAEKPLGESDDEEEEEEEEECEKGEKKEELDESADYGQKHSMFLRYSERYL